MAELQTYLRNCRKSAGLTQLGLARKLGMHSQQISNNERGCRSPSISQSARNTLWRQCSELTCPNIMSSTSVGLRPSC